MQQFHSGIYQQELLLADIGTDICLFMKLHWGKIPVGKQDSGFEGKKTVA